MKKIEIQSSKIAYVREPLLAPFGFKGNYLNELWQTIVWLESNHAVAVSPCVESVLWSDAKVFEEHTPAESSRLMMKVTEYALHLSEGQTFERPDRFLEQLLPELQAYANKICGRVVAPTFVLNSLVGFDLALWILYAKENGMTSFDEIIPESTKAAMPCHHQELARIPLLSYAVSEQEIRRLLERGTALLKIKIGKAIPNCVSHEDDMRQMVHWDIERLREIHRIASDYSSEMTKTGHILYYLDANGRYDRIELVEELLDAADKMGALPYIALLEEPLPEENLSDVRNLPVCVNADESAHSLEDVKKRLSLGYSAVALKPIAKTLSVTFQMAEAAYQAGAQCLCADLTVNPFLAEWNKQFAARIHPLLGMNVGCVEVNGDQNYTNWESMKLLLPDHYQYQEENHGRFLLPESFFASSGKLFQENGYRKYFNEKR